MSPFQSHFLDLRNCVFFWLLCLRVIQYLPLDRGPGIDWATHQVTRQFSVNVGLEFESSGMSRLVPKSLQVPWEVGCALFLTPSYRKSTKKGNSSTVFSLCLLLFPKIPFHAFLTYLQTESTLYPKPQLTTEQARTPWSGAPRCLGLSPGYLSWHHSDSWAESES